MRAALAPPAAALGSRARCSPPGAVSVGLRAPADWAMLSGVARRAAGEGRVNRRGRAPGGSHGKGSVVGPGRASFPEGLIGDRARRAHLRLPEPWSLYPQGRSRPPGAWGAEVQRERLKEGRSCSTLDRGGHFPGSRTWLPRLLSTNQRSLLPASGCVPPARGNSGRCLFGSVNSIPSRWLLRARKAG